MFDVGLFSISVLFLKRKKKKKAINCLLILQETVFSLVSFFWVWAGVRGGSPKILFNLFYSNLKLAMFFIFWNGKWAREASSPY